jgi:sensor histidine kinase YesM
MILLEVINDQSIPGVNFYYVTTGLFGFAVIFIIVGIFNYFRKAFEKMIEKMNRVEMEQVKMKGELEYQLKETSDNMERIKRLERLEGERYNEEFADLLIQKIRAITPK